MMERVNIDQQIQQATERTLESYHRVRAGVYDLFPDAAPPPGALTDAQQDLIRDHEQAEHELAQLRETARSQFRQGNQPGAAALKAHEFDRSRPAGPNSAPSSAP